MELFLIAVAAFISVVLIVTGIFLVLQNWGGWNPERKRIHSELTSLSRELPEPAVDIMRKVKPLSDIPWLNAILVRIPYAHSMNRLIQQAGLGYSLGYFLLLALLLALVTFGAVQYVTPNLPLSLAAAAVAGALPIVYVGIKKKRRMQRFEQQLPDALDLIGSSLRAGHAFTGGLFMVTQEFTDPLRGEFEKVLNELNLGIGLDEAMTNLLERVDCPDLKFFAVSLILQRETGGNLAEIMGSIARLIRERFKLYDKVKALAAEGRLSVYILSAIPFFFALLLVVINREFFTILIQDPIGRVLIVIALVMMVLGYVVMEKTIKIKV